MVVAQGGAPMQAPVEADPTERSMTACELLLKIWNAYALSIAPTFNCADLLFIS